MFSIQISFKSAHYQTAIIFKMDLYLCVFLPQIGYAVQNHTESLENILHFLKDHLRSLKAASLSLLQRNLTFKM